MKPKTRDEKKALIESYQNCNITMKEFAEQNNISYNAIYTWRNEFKTRGEKVKTLIGTVKKESKKIKSKKAKNSTTTRTTRATNNKQAILRIELYDQLKLEYEELTDQLATVHHRMKMLGEEWEVTK